MTCNYERRCALVECGKSFISRDPRRLYCTAGCKSRARQVRLGAGARRPRLTDLGPEHPTMFMTEDEAMDRIERIAAEMLREGLGGEVVEERFSQSGINVTRVRRRFNLPAENDRLPYGLPG